MSPLMDVANATKSIPLLFAFLLGIVGTLASCQLTGNISAWTISMGVRKRNSANINFVFPMITQTNRTFINFNGANIIRHDNRKKFLLYPLPYHIYTKTK
ncbi:hypothetical protein BWGOE8_18160 [Bacillus mycoides]|uniref:Uncharacterized protein n=1 Tax=Bacillus mycoides TaxID=1405 RepID=A0A1E8B9L4_BACMY|nr:hypothetical protein BWGOE8_18160 [Bacillus mycoides]OFD81585.1 hypothetical protein BWGOE9_17850 [Bacillus mycoides]OFD83876.1 hypothetical protein BWGOE10_18040 [Bacillus mycoides]